MTREPGDLPSVVVTREPMERGASVAGETRHAILACTGKNLVRGDVPQASRRGFKMSSINRVRAFHSRTPVALLVSCSLGGLLVASPALAQAQAPQPEATTAASAQLPAEVIALDTVSVTANLTPTDLSKVGSAVSIITGEELRKQNIRLVSEALRQVPGVAVNRTGPVGNLTQVRMRGSEGNQTLVMIDGIVVNNPATGSEFDFANLLSDDIERIEVLRGPQSALYGSDAIGGVISIITKKGDGKPRVSARLEGGTQKTLNGGATVSMANDRAHFLLSGSGFTTDGFSVADSRNGNYERDGYRNGTSYTKFGFIPNDYLEFNFVGRYTKFFNKNDDEIGGVGAVDADMDNKGSQVFGRAEAKVKLLDGRWNHIFSSSVTDQNTVYRTLRQPTSDYRGTTNNYEYRTNLRFDTPSFLDATHIVTFAAQHRNERYRSNSAWANDDRTMATTGLVGEYQGTFQNLTVTASVRHDNNDIFKDSTTYRFTGAYRIDETGTKLRSSIGSGVKNPTMSELYGYTNTYRGNPNLSPEKARGWDVGVDQEVWGQRVVLNATYFNQRISDMITGAGNTSVNLPGTSAIQGMELGATIRPVEGLTVMGSYTYTSGKDSTGAELVRRPKNVASLNVNYAFLEGKANVNLGVTYNGDQKDWAFDANWNKRVVNLSAYTLVNLGASYKVHENAELYVKVDNIFDKRYQEVYSYGSAGRTAVFGARVSF